MPATVPPSTATRPVRNRLSHRSSAMAAEDNGGPATATSEAPGRLGGSAAHVLSHARGKYQSARSRPLGGVGWLPTARSRAETGGLGDSSFTGVPSACPSQRARAVTGGQPRLVEIGADLAVRPPSRTALPPRRSLPSS